MGMKGNLPVMLICISLISNGFRHLFMYILAMCIFSLEKCLFPSFALKKKGLHTWMAQLVECETLGISGL